MDKYDKILEMLEDIKRLLVEAIEEDDEDDLLRPYFENALEHLDNMGL